MDLKATRVAAGGDGVATVHLHRPERGNAWTGRMHTEYRWIFAQLEADPDVRAVVVTGSGRSFCVGGDSQALVGHERIPSHRVILATTSDSSSMTIGAPRPFGSGDGGIGRDDGAAGSRWLASGGSSQAASEAQDERQGEQVTEEGGDLNGGAIPLAQLRASIGRD